MLTLSVMMVGSGFGSPIVAEFHRYMNVVSRAAVNHVGLLRVLIVWMEGCFSVVRLGSGVYSSLIGGSQKA